MIKANEIYGKTTTQNEIKAIQLEALIDAVIHEKGKQFTMDEPAGYSAVSSAVLAKYRQNGWAVESGAQYNEGYWQFKATATKPGKITLLNTSIVTGNGLHRLLPCSLNAACDLVRSAPIDSAIGHEATAQILTDLLGITVSVNRQVYASAPGSIALVFKLKGRPPEGKILSMAEMEQIGYEFFTLEHLHE